MTKLVLAIVLSVAINLIAAFIVNSTVYKMEWYAFQNYILIFGTIFGFLKIEQHQFDKEHWVKTDRRTKYRVLWGTVPFVIVMYVQMLLDLTPILYDGGNHTENFRRLVVSLVITMFATIVWFYVRSRLKFRKNIDTDQQRRVA